MACNSGRKRDGSGLHHSERNEKDVLINNFKFYTIHTKEDSFICFLFRKEFLNNLRNECIIVIVIWKNIFAVHL